MIAERTKKPLRLFAVALLALALFTACSSKAAKVQEKMELGQKYLTELNYTEAVVSFTEAIELDPDDIPAYMGRAEAYVGLKQYDDAKADYTTVIEKTADQPYMQAEAYVGRAEVNELTDENEAALSDYKTASTALDKVDLGKIKGVTEQMLEALKVKVYNACARLSAESYTWQKDQPEGGFQQKEDPLANALRIGQSVNLGGVTITMTGVTRNELVWDSSDVLEVWFDIHNGSGKEIWHGNLISLQGGASLSDVRKGYRQKTEFQVTSGGKTLQNAQDGSYAYTTPELIANDDWGELGYDDLLPDGTDSSIYVYFELTGSDWENAVLTYTPSYAGGKSAAFVVTPSDVEVYNIWG